VNKVALALSLLIFGVLVFSGWKAWEQAVAYEDATLAIIDRLDADKRMETVVQRLLEWLSFGLYQGGEDEVAQLADLKRLQQAYAASVHLMTLVFFALVPPFLFALWRVRRERGDVAYGMLGAALVALGVGLAAPILSVEASKSLPLVGETVFQFESKGILSTVQSLWGSGNAWLAALLLCFSVVIPVLKTSLVALTFWSDTHHWSLRGFALSQHIGKWSMADVFVVAILVAYLANHGHGVTDAEVQAGLYFFAGYVVLSLVATQLIAHRLSKR